MVNLYSNLFSLFFIEYDTKDKHNKYIILRALRDMHG